MKPEIFAMFILITACGSGGFNSETETASRPRTVVTDGKLHSDDAHGEESSKGEGQGADSKPTGDMSSLCPGFDKATIDALIASGKPFELECELEVGDDD